MPLRFCRWRKSAFRGWPPLNKSYHGVPRERRTLTIKVARNRLESIDALRGVAILSVVAGHFGYTLLRPYSFSGFADIVHETLRFGWVGVDLFFVLSGFLITSLLFERRTREGYYRDFYIRRALRILPLYLLILLVLAVTGIAPLGFIILSVFFAANFAGSLPAGNPYGILWSLAIEEQFYLFWPTVVHRIRPRHAGYVGVAVLVLSPMIRLAAWSFGADGSVLYYITPFHLDGLAMGVLIAALVHDARTSDAHLRSFALGALSAAIALTLVGAHWGILTRDAPLGAALQFSVIALIFGAVVVLALIVKNARLRAILAPRVLRFYGDISYGLYLIHILTFTVLEMVLKVVAPQLVPSASSPGLAVAEVAFAFALATTVAYLSRRYFEQPFLRLKDKLTQRPKTQDEAAGVEEPAPS